MKIERKELLRRHLAPTLLAVYCTLLIIVRSENKQGVLSDALLVDAVEHPFPNGPVLGNNGGDAGPYRDGKWTDFEGRIRVPCIMRWPGVIEPGSRNSQITAIIDLLPTFCAIAGVSPPDDWGINGRNILLYMKGEKVEQPIHESFIVPGSVIRHGNWKLLVRDLKPGGKCGREGKRPSALAGSLFNLKADPGETRDVSAEHPEIVADLRSRMDAAVRELEANSQPIGRLGGTPVPATKNNRSKKDKQ